MFSREHFHFPISPKAPRIGFDHTGTEYWKEWDRYLTLDGKKVFHIGNVCDTCPFFFSKVEDVEQELGPSEISERLAESKNLLDPAFLDLIGQILPADDYFVSRIRFKPKLVFTGDQNDYFANECPALYALGEYSGGSDYHDTNTPYYRDSGIVLAKDKLLINFIIPFQPPATLSQERVAYYCNQFANGQNPTAFSISVLDIESPAVLREKSLPLQTEHWCLVHYLLDGHHKIHAAAKAGLECSLLCFISRKQSFGGDDALTVLGEALTHWT